MKSLLAFVVAVAPAFAGATTVRHFTETEMVAHAAVVVRGTVETVAARHHPSGVIVTDVTVRVARLLKANVSSDRITFVQLGGTIDGLTLNVPGRSNYDVGEEVVVFLERDGGDLVEIGVGAGKYRVTRAADGRAWVERQLNGLNFVRYQDRRGQVVTPPRPDVEALEELEARLAAQVGG